jgi:large subunit ribosomal protein L35
MAKRFKVTGSGKVLRRTTRQRHLMRKLSKKRKRRAAVDKPVAKSLARHVKVAAPGIF